MKLTNVLGYVAIIIIIFAYGFFYFKPADLQLKCIISNVNGNTFCVRDRTRINEAADLLAKITENAKRLVKHLHEKYPDKDLVKRLIDGFNPDSIKETMPNSIHTAYTENKKDMYFCLNVKRNKNESELIDEHTLMFVTIHEMAHICSKGIGHKSEFWENFRFLLDEAKQCGVHEPVDYRKAPAEYCSTKINDNPYFELKGK
jgi:hypothetical protein